MLDSNGISKKIIVNTFVQAGSKLLSVLVALLTVGLLTRYLGLEGYGKFTLVFTYLSFFAIISDFGLNQLIVREFSNEKDKTLIIRKNFFSLKFLLNLLSIFLPILILPLFPYSESLKLAIVIGAFSVAVGNMTSYGTSILQAELRLDLVAYLDLLTKFVTALVIYSFVRINAGLYSMIIAILVGNFFGLSITYLLVRKHIKFGFNFNLSIVKRLLKLGIPIGLSSLLALLYFKIDTLMLSIMRSPVEVGIYGLSYKVFENALILWGLYMASVFPLLSKFYIGKEVKKYQYLLKKTLIVLISFSFIFIIFSFYFTPLIMRILGGREFYLSILPFRILTMSIPLFFLNNILYNVFLSFGKTKYLLFPLAFSLAINLLCNLYAIPKYGYLGTSVTTVISELLSSIAYIVILSRYFRNEAVYWRIYI